MMEISDQLSKPLLDRLCYEYKKLENELMRHPSEEAVKLRASIQKRIRQMESLNQSPESFQPASDDISADTREAIRQLKLDLRFSKRRWQRTLLNEVRLFKRGQSKVPATFAA